MVNINDRNISPSPFDPGYHESNQKDGLYGQYNYPVGSMLHDIVEELKKMNATLKKLANK